MSRREPIFRAAARTDAPADPAVARHATRMRGNLKLMASGDFQTEPGAERADLLVPPDVADHYFRQGERIADAVMALTDLARSAMTRLRNGRSGESVHQPFTRLR